MQNSQLAHMEDQAPITSFGRYLRKIRITRKVTLRELANRAQLSPSYISSVVAQLDLPSLRAPDYPPDFRLHSCSYQAAGSGKDG
jgi:hypothetical protein